MGEYLAAKWTATRRDGAERLTMQRARRSDRRGDRSARPGAAGAVAVGSAQRSRPAHRNTTCCCGAATSSIRRTGSARCGTSRSPAARSPRSRRSIDPAEPSRRSTSPASTSRRGSSTSTRTSTPAPARSGSYAGDNSVYPTASRSASGVTTIVDAGWSGWRNFDDFKQRIIDRSQDPRARLPQHRRQRDARRQVRAGPGGHGGASRPRTWRAGIRA